MKITQKLSQAHSIRKLSSVEAELGQNVFRKNLGRKQGESIVIVSDEHYWQKEAAIWFEAAKTSTQIGTVTLFVIEGMTHSGQEPPEEVIAACAETDMAIFHTFFSLTHTSAKRALLENGGRGFSLPGVDHAMMLRTLTTDFTPIRELGAQLQTRLENAKTIHITSNHGTDLTASIRQQRVISDDGFATEPSTFGNLPAGEVFFAPLDDSANGIWIVNGSMADMEEEIDGETTTTTSKREPIVITMKNGMAVQISGGKSAQLLKDKLDAVGPDAYHVAEIGIGINPDANPLGKLIEAEKAYGTAHLALGNSKSFGGSVDVPIHLDGVTLEPEIALDSKTVLSVGEFVLAE